MVPRISHVRTIRPSASARSTSAAVPRRSREPIAHSDWP